MKYAVIGAAIILIGLGIFLYEQQAQAPEVTLGNQYENTEYGISFSYPDGYVRMAQTVEDWQMVTTQLRSYEVRIRRYQNGEGPTGITIDVYDVSADTTLLGWLNATPASNLTLANGPSTSTTVAGEEAVTYRWSGLYEGETTAFMSGTRVVTVSVTRLEPSDHTAAYVEILRTFKSTN